LSQIQQIDGRTIFRLKKEFRPQRVKRAEKKLEKQKGQKKKQKNLQKAEKVAAQV
jgi:hypothetical protein